MKQRQSDIEQWIRETEKIAKRITCETQLSSSLVYQQNSSGHFAMSVTPRTFDRAMRLLRQLIGRFEKEGWAFSVEGSGGSEPASAVMVEGERIPFKIREKHTRVQEKSGSRISSTLKPNGQLAVEFYIRWSFKPSRIYRDSDSSKVEEIIDDMVEWLKLACKKVREDRIESERWQAEMEEKYRIEKELESRRKNRINEVKSVMLDFRRFQKARELREYSQALKRHLFNLPVDCSNKIQTALEIADWIDPLTEYEDPLLSEKISIKDLLLMLG